MSRMKAGAHNTRRLLMGKTIWHKESVAGVKKYLLLKIQESGIVIKGAAGVIVATNYGKESGEKIIL
jgi:hypothetical protein